MDQNSRSFKILSKVFIETKDNNLGAQEMPENFIDFDAGEHSDHNELSLAMNNLQEEYFQAQKVLQENIDPNIGNADFVEKLMEFDTTDDITALIDPDCLNNPTVTEDLGVSVQNSSSENDTFINNNGSNALPSSILEQEKQIESDSDKDWDENERSLEKNLMVLDNISERDESENNKKGVQEGDFRDNNEELNTTEIGSGEEETVDPMNKKRKRNKNRLSDSNKWEYNENKRKREKGEMYLGRKENKFIVKKCQREIKTRCSCSKEKKNSFLCYKINEEERHNIFLKFWNLSWQEKQVYVLGRTTTTETKRARNRKDDSISRRTDSCMFFLDKKREERVRVCKTMFCNTLGMSPRTITLWIHKGNSSPEKSSIKELATNSSKKTEDSKVTTELTNKGRLEKKITLRDFFNCLPKLESHYCRKSTSKLYLEPRWRNKSELYILFKDSWCEENKIQPASMTLFNYVFEEMNLSLFSPKKDECDVCVAYKTKNTSEEIYKMHILKKEEARTEKEKDKRSSDKVFTMDLQSVLLCPKSNVSALYYKTKLIVHNFTIFDLQSKDGYCFIWHEGEGELKANCFASIICNFLSTKVLPSVDTDNKPNIILYSDGCGAQNRNSILANALLNFALHNNVCIIQKYLEKGHTQMECDSMHSLIERKISGRIINVPADYVYYAKAARKTPKPYEVQYLQHTYFKDFSKLNFFNSIRPGHKVGDPTVQDIRALRYNPVGTIEFKLRHSEEFQTLPVRFNRNSKSSTIENLPRLYQNKLKIKREKFEHLQSLKTTMEQDYHAFYDSLDHEY